MYDTSEKYLYYLFIFIYYSCTIFRANNNVNNTGNWKILQCI